MFTQGTSYDPGMPTLGEVKETIRTNLIRLRSQRGLTIAQVDARAGNTMTRHIETGVKIPGLGTIIQLANALDVEPAYFLREIRKDDSPELVEFLATNAAHGITDEELDKLRNLRGAGFVQTVATYAIALTALRTRAKG